MGSTCLTPTEDSKDWAKLGEYIVAQLGESRRGESLLAHWIAHQLAEHLSAAEDESDPERAKAAQAAAEALIPQLWSARLDWPCGWPPQAAQEFVDAISATQAFAHEEPGLTVPWLATLGELESLRGEEHQIWIYAALLELGVAGLRAALDAAPEDEEGEDVAYLRMQLRRVEEAQRWVGEHALEGERATRRADRALIFGRALADLARRRAALVERTLTDARRGSRRKRSPGNEAHGARRASPHRKTP